MKEYPLNEDNLDELEAIGKDASLDLALASGLLGFFINVALTVTMSEHWTTAFWVWCTLGVCALIGSAISWYRWWHKSDSGIRLIQRIRTQTTHD